MLEAVGIKGRGGYAKKADPQGIRLYRKLLSDQQKRLSGEEVDYPLDETSQSAGLRLISSFLGAVLI